MSVAPVDVISTPGIGGDGSTINSASLLVGNVERPSAQADQLTAVRVSVDSISGAVTNIGLASIYGVGSDGMPTGAALGSQTFTPASNTTLTVSFSTPVSLSAGQRFAVLLSNQSASPSSNWYRVRRGPALWSPAYGVQSGDSGTSWVVTGDGAGVRIHLVAPILQTQGWHAEQRAASNDAPGAGIALYNASGRIARAARLVSIPYWLCSGVSLRVNKVGNPPAAYPLTVEIWSGSTLKASADFTPAASGQHVVWFQTPAEIVGDGYVAVRPKNQPQGDASNHWKVDVAYDNARCVTSQEARFTLLQSYNSTDDPGPSWALETVRDYSIWPIVSIGQQPQAGSAAGPDFRGGFTL